MEADGRRVLYLGNRGDPGPGGVIDFDGGDVRRITLRSGPLGSAPRWWLFSVDPSIPDLDGRPMTHVALADRHRTRWLERLIEGPEDVDSLVAGVHVADGTSQAPFERGAMYWGEVARTPEDLPRSPFDHEREYVALDDFVAREGHADVLLSEIVDGLALGHFVDKIRELEVVGGLAPETRDRLSALPGWRWYESDTIGLLGEFAKREGSAFVPRGHIEQGRQLGTGVRSLAEAYAMAKAGLVRLPAEDVERLEALPKWLEAVAAYEREVGPGVGFGTEPSEGSFL